MTVIRAKEGTYMHKVYYERMVGNDLSFKRNYAEAQRYIVDNPGTLLFSNSLVAFLHDRVIEKDYVYNQINGRTLSILNRR